MEMVTLLQHIECYVFHHHGQSDGEYYLLFSYN